MQPGHHMLCVLIIHCESNTEDCDSPNPSFLCKLCPSSLKKQVRTPACSGLLPQTTQMTPPAACSLQPRECKAELVLGADLSVFLQNPKHFQTVIYFQEERRYLPRLLWLHSMLLLAHKQSGFVRRWTLRWKLWRMFEFRIDGFGSFMSESVFSVTKLELVLCQPSKLSATWCFQLLETAASAAESVHNHQNCL